MGVKQLDIYFDNPSKTYFAGQTVTGRVELNLSSVKSVRGIHLTFKGAAETHWTESESRRSSNGKTVTSRVSYDAHEEYFSIRSYLLGGPDHNTIELPVGSYKYTFTCVVPPNAPSSFEGEHGHVRYTVKVTLDRPWKFDNTFKEAYTVISPFDLNYNPQLRQPATLTMEKYFCCLMCKSGPLSGILKVPCTGFVPGQVVPVTLEIDNVSNENVEGAKLMLKSMVIYTSHTPKRSTKERSAVVWQHDMGAVVSAKSSKTFYENITVPVIPPSHLTNCSIINISYEVEIEVLVSGCHTNMYGNLPVTIGTVPLNNLVPLTSSVESQQNAVSGMNSNVSAIGWVPAPSNSIGDPIPTPPPSYKECMFRTNSIMDSNDSEHTKCNNDYFAPNYPVYNFNMEPSAPEDSCHKEEPSAPLLPKQ